MSVRAYKINDTNTEPSFNLWHDADLLIFFESCDNKVNPSVVQGGGLVELRVSTIKKALKEFQWAEEGDYRKDQLEEDIAGKKDDEWVNYYCI